MQWLSNRIKVVLIVLLLLGTLIVLVNKATAAEFTGIAWDAVRVEPGWVLMQDSTNNCYLAITNGGYSFFKLRLKTECVHSTSGYCGIQVKKWDSDTGTTWSAGTDGGLTWAGIVAECEGNANANMENQIEQSLRR